MNYLLDSSNAAISSVTFMGSTLAGPKGNVSLDGVPLGLVNGEIAVKVTGTGGGGIPITPQTVNSLPQNLAASSSLVIPVGAKGWTVTCLTGTITIATSTTASALPAGFSDSDPNTVGAAITVTTASASTAYVRWGT